jgi:hypothetical protein
VLQLAPLVFSFGDFSLVLDILSAARRQAQSLP